MKVLCLHGAHSNASNFEVQLRPFVDAVGIQSEAFEFKWIDGAYGSTPPPGYEDYFGKPPLYRHINFDGTNAVDDMLWKIRDMAKGRTPEDSMRQLISQQKPLSAQLVNSAMDRLIKALDDDPEIDGILGYSEGAMMASSLILEECRRFEEEGRPRRIKYGIFFGGWPPVRPNGEVASFQLSDECEDVIDVPTFHIIGCNDPYLHGALSLYSMCDEDTATLFDHGKGHTVPRDARTIEELATAVQSVWSRTEICA